jgi:hypothetical protein
VILPLRTQHARHAIWCLRSKLARYLEAYLSARCCSTLAEAHNTQDSDTEFTGGATQLILAGVSVDRYPQ